MYEAHFGLKSRPFGSRAEGAAVFVGPHQAKIIGSLQKSLVAHDAVVTITGPAGVGKTTMVNRALETLSPARKVAWVGRMPLAAEEVMELLLAGFGIRKKANSSIRQFAAFRRLLREHTQAGAPVAIVVEDAQRIGEDALGELEALTADENGDESGANIILMGQPGLRELLAKPELARMNQRCRLRQIIEPYTRADVTGYLKHSIENAGGKYEAIFEDGVADIVFACAEGIPRVINTLCSSALTAAREAGVGRVSAALMHQVATDAFGYDGPMPAAAPAAIVDSTEAEAPAAAEAAPAVAPPEEAPAPEDDKSDAAERAEASVGAAEKDSEIALQAPTPTAAEVEKLTEEELPKAARNLVVESGRYPETPDGAAAAATPVAAETDAEPDPDLDDIPELINDTQPELARLEMPEPKVTPQEVSARQAADALVDPEIPVLRPEAPRAGPGTIAGKASSTAKFDAAPMTERSELAPANGAPELAAPDPADEKTGEPVVETGVTPATGDDADNVGLTLEAVLSPDPGATNRMKALTAGLESATADAQSDELEAAPIPPGAPAAADDVMALADDLDTPSTSVPAAEVAPDDAEYEKQVEAAFAAEAPLLELELEPDLQPAKVEEPPSPAAANAVPELFPMEDTATSKTNIDALEAALEAAKNLDFDAAPESAAAANAPAAAEIPEITLDQTLGDRQPENAKLEKFAAEIGKANSLEDISDTMAETLFGCEELEQIAAEVVANPPPGMVAPGVPADEPSPVKLDETEAPMAANDAAEPVATIKPAAKPTPKPSAPPTKTNITEEKLKESVAMRIEMLKAINNQPAGVPGEKVRPGQGRAAPDTAKAKGPKPEPIENQIDTSITKTLQALDLPKLAEKEREADKKRKKSGGLFSRFKKSS